MAGWKEVIFKSSSAADLGLVGAARGNILIANASSVYANFTAGASGKVLTAGGVAADLTWETPCPIVGSEEGSVLVSGAGAFTYTEFTHGTSGQVLTTGGDAAQPTWETPTPRVGAAEGNLLVAGAAAHTYANFTAGASGKVLTAGGVDAALTWETPCPINAAEEGSLLASTSTPFAYTELAHGTAGQVLQSGGHGAQPSWTAAGAGDLKADGTVAMTANFDLNDHTLIDAKLHTTIPGAPADGHIYFDTATDKVKVYVA